MIVETACHVCSFLWCTHLFKDAGFFFFLKSLFSVSFNLVIQFEPFLFQGLYDIDLMHASSLVIYTT